MTLEKIRRRITALEEKVDERFPKPQPPSQKDIEILREFLKRLLSTMAPEHWPLVEAYLKDPKQGLHTFGSEEGPIPQGLARTLHDMWYSFRKGSARTVALPPVVVEVYLQDPRAAPHEDCADCGLLLPIHCGQKDPPEEPCTHFPECPLCGGVTGLQAYAIAHKESDYENLTPYTRDDSRGFKRCNKEVRQGASKSLKD